MYCSLGFAPYESYQMVMRQYWQAAERLGVDQNPYRAGVMQIVCVAETDAQAEEDYAPHVMYLAKKLQHLPIRYTVPPGYMSAASFINFRKLWADNINRQDSWKAMVDKGIIVAGSPATVRDTLAQRLTELRAGHLLALLQVGSMPTALARKNMELFAREVMPHLRGLWDEYEDRWWPHPLPGAQAA
jgi:alkanesulfonate monooxygenase SsuD/methylene tetrahydromethanopterin reductase-like flavin-dependent oxidoreductase (luciferase family)